MKQKPSSAHASAAHAASAATNQDENSDQVKFKPIMGVRPGVYLAVLYSLVIIVIVFFLLVLPGIKNPVAALIVKTEPAGAAVRVNDIYMGVSGSKIIVPKGEHTITAAMPGFESQSVVMQIPGRVFASLFFPKKYIIDFTLTTPDPAAAFSLYAADYAAWSFAGEASETWQVPMSLSEGAYRIGREQLTEDSNLSFEEQRKESNERLQKILESAAGFTGTKVGMRDLIRAKILLDNYGNSPSPVTLVTSISDAFKFLSENQGSAAWLSNFITGDAASAFKSSAWAKNVINSQIEFVPLSGETAGASRLNLSGLYFSRISASEYRQFGKTGLIESFYINENPVPRSLFEEFLSVNPEWRNHLTDYEAEEIASAPQETYNRNIITGITWYAAEAFCKWLTDQLPSSISAMEVRLPTEYEWEYAALSISNMKNPGWEWCVNHYVPNQFIKVSDKALQSINSPERSLRGKPPGNTSNTETRASLPPDLSSPIVTFRPVIAAR